MKFISIERQIEAVTEQMNVLKTSYRSPITLKMNDREAIRDVNALGAAILTLKAKAEYRPTKADQMAQALAGFILTHHAEVIGAREWSRIYDRAKAVRAEILKSKSRTMKARPLPVKPQS